MMTYVGATIIWGDLYVSSRLLSESSNSHAELEGVLVLQHITCALRHQRLLRP